MTYSFSEMYKKMNMSYIEVGFLRLKK
jgi:hypothetical protein